MHILQCTAVATTFCIVAMIFELLIYAVTCLPYIVYCHRCETFHIPRLLYRPKSVTCAEAVVHMKLDIWPVKRVLRRISLSPVVTHYVGQAGLSEKLKEHNIDEKSGY